MSNTLNVGQTVFRPRPEVFFSHMADLCARAADDTDICNQNYGSSCGVVEKVREVTRSVIDLSDSLRKIGVHKKLPIPQIAVMGDQSSGKSSVLEAISGVPFPRGSGLVTRCPTMVIMSKGANWRAEVSTRDETHVVESEEHKSLIAEHIDSFTKILAGGGKGFSNNDDFIEIKLHLTTS